MMGGRVLTIILNWRTPEMTLRAAQAVLIALEQVSGELVIVDNDSGDGSFETLASEVVARGWTTGPQAVRVLQAGKNGGYGAGNNFGMRAQFADGSEPDYVYVLNSDAFPEPLAVKALLARAESDPTAGILGSFIQNEQGEPQRVAFRFPSIAAEFEAQVRFGPISRLFERAIVAQPVPPLTTRVDWVAGASMLLRRKMLDQIGMFDEGFFLYFEETDLSLRAARAGWSTVFVRESCVTHVGAASTGKSGWARTPRYWFDSRLRYFTKNHGRAYACAATASHMAGALAWRLRLLIQRKDRGDPPRYLRDLTHHAIGSAWRAAFRPSHQSDNKAR